MSRLREQLESARADYRRARYSGDLVADVQGALNDRLQPARPRLHQHRSRLYIVPLGVAGGAVAAAVALIVLWSRPFAGPSGDSLHATPNPPDRTRIAKADPPALSPSGGADARSALALPDLPAMPDWSAMPAMPTIPAIAMATPTVAVAGPGPVGPTHPGGRGAVMTDVPDMSVMASMALMAPAPAMSPPGWFDLPAMPAADAGKSYGTTNKSTNPSTKETP